MEDRGGGILLEGPRPRGEILVHTSKVVSRYSGGRATGVVVMEGEPGQPQHAVAYVRSIVVVVVVFLFFIVNSRRLYVVVDFAVPLSGTTLPPPTATITTTTTTTTTTTVWYCPS